MSTSVKNIGISILISIYFGRDDKENGEWNVPLKPFLYSIKACLKNIEIQGFYQSFNILGNNSQSKHLYRIPNIGILQVNTYDMSKNTSVTLGDHFEQIIQRTIESGRYSSASEVIRAGLRMVEEKEQKVKLLREAIEAGERSGYVKNFDPAKHLAELNRNRAK